MSRARRPSTHRASRAKKRVGLAPGTPVYTGDAVDVEVVGRIFDYGPDRLREEEAATWDRIRACRDSASITWIDIVGLHDIVQLTGVTSHFGLHGLAVEDLLSTDTRPKVEDIGEHTLVVLKMVTVSDVGLVNIEHTGFVLGPTWVLTLQERPGDVFGPVRERLRVATTRIRSRGADYLLHGLTDAVVDAYFNGLERFETLVDDLEVEALGSAGPDFALRVHTLKTQLRRFRRAVWPLRTALAPLYHDGHARVLPETLPYFRDLADNAALALDILDSIDDRLISVLELHLATTSNRMNEVMRVLTIVTTLFVPITFLAGIYGMNFKWMPELELAYGYPTALAVMATVTGGSLAWMRRSGWI